MSTSESVSLRYTGRYASDPLGQMTLSEGTFVIGTGNSSSFRYADYAHLSVDPNNDKSFWHVSEYFTGFNTRTHRVGVFQIAPDAQFDLGVVSIDSPQSGSLSNSESITVSVFNYGENEISNFDISYSINGGPIDGTYSNLAIINHSGAIFNIPICKVSHIKDAIYHLHSR